MEYSLLCSCWGHCTDVEWLQREYVWIAFVRSYLRLVTGSTSTGRTRIQVHYLQKFRTKSGIFHSYTTRKGCITILYHVIEKTVARWPGRLGVMQLNCTNRWEGSVEYWQIYHGSPVIFSMAWYKVRYKLRSSPKLLVSFLPGFMSETE